MRGARKCTQWPECVSVSVFFFRGCKKMYSMARVCVCVPLQGVQENVLNGQSVCLCVCSSSGGARKCTQWPVCVSVSGCLLLFRGCKKMYSMTSVCLCVYSSSRGARKCTQRPVCVCMSIPLQGVQENVPNGQCVSVSVCLFIFRGCKKMYSMASVCVSLCLYVYSSSGGARKCTQWPECVSIPL